jgi:hypothetical protein
MGSPDTPEQASSKRKPEREPYVYLRDRMDKYNSILDLVVHGLQNIGNLTLLVLLAAQKLIQSKRWKS